MTDDGSVMGASQSRQRDKEDRLIAAKTGFSIAQVHAWRELFTVITDVYTFDDMILVIRVLMYGPSIMQYIVSCKGIELDRQMAHLTLTLFTVSDWMSNLITYCLLRPTQPPTNSWKHKSSSWRWDTRTWHDVSSYPVSYTHLTLPTILRV